MTYTANPELDAARHDDEEQAADDLHEKAKREAPAIVLKQLQAIKKPKDWWEKYSFAGGNSAEDILQQGMSVNDDVADRYAEFMIDATKEARDKMLQAMADWFASVYAFEVYTDHLEELSDD